MCLLQTKTFPVYKNVLKFQNEYNKVEIELRVVQFWTEIKLVITNRTPASRSCDFVITRLISVQIALHSVQLPLFILLLLWLLKFEFARARIRTFYIEMILFQCHQILVKTNNSNFE